LQFKTHNTDNVLSYTENSKNYTKWWKTMDNRYYSC